MMHGSFAGQRRYSITHRAVQRLRELVTTMGDLDDESLRDRLDAALSSAEERGDVVKTLDAMLGEPQMLVPVIEFGTTLYAIIKEDTVVTVLPQGHGEEILQRGKALQDRVKSGDTPLPERQEEDRWSENGRRRWHRNPPAPVIIERQSRQSSRQNLPNHVGAHESTTSSASNGLLSSPVGSRPDHKVEGAIYDALHRGRQAAAVAALGEVLRSEPRDSDLIGIWNDLTQQGVPYRLTVGDLIDACARL